VSQDPNGAVTAGTMEIWVRAGERAWGVVLDEYMQISPSNTVRCQFNHLSTLHPGETYEVRWYRMDRGRFAEITREKFELRHTSNNRHRKCDATREAQRGTAEQMVCQPRPEQSLAPPSASVGSWHDKKIDKSRSA
jgi:hypothetical protein